MLDDRTDPHSIEARVTRDRAELAASVAALRDRLNLDSLVSDGAAAIRRHAGPPLRAVDRAVRDNPAGVALMLAGVACLAFGRRRAPDAPAPDPLAGTKFEAISRWEDEGGPVSPDPRAAPAPRDDWMAEAEGIGKRAREALAVLDRAAARALAPAADIARDRAQVLADRAADLARVFRKDLDGLSEAAQDRIAQARKAAFQARQANTVREMLARMAEDFPLATAAVAAGAGAALASAFPVTDAERRTLAAPREALLAEARRVLDEERGRAEVLAENLAADLREDMRRATGRVAETARAIIDPEG
ncbi:MAG: hypothetical protein KF887_19075 [Paracoccaceae bacterium]|nr:MAG: hypothetical protein KF887_19075 [Paracoccaceae bacterium]